MNLLTSAEMRRFIARMGGLFSAGDLSSLLGPSARAYPTYKGFPSYAWKTGRSKLYVGWEVWVWLEQTGRIQDARLLKSELEGLKRRKFN